MTSEGGRGTLIIRDVKEADQGAYTCEAMNARGMVFGIPDGVLELVPQRGAAGGWAGGYRVGDWCQYCRTSCWRPAIAPSLPPSRPLPRWTLLPGGQCLLPALLLLWCDQRVPEQSALPGPDPAEL